MTEARLLRTSTWARSLHRARVGSFTSFERYAAFSFSERCAPRSGFDDGLHLSFQGPEISRGGNEDRARSPYSVDVNVLRTTSTSRRCQNYPGVGQSERPCRADPFQRSRESRWKVLEHRQPFAEVRLDRASTMISTIHRQLLCGFAIRRASRAKLTEYYGPREPAADRESNRS